MAALEIVNKLVGKEKYWKIFSKCFFLRETPLNITQICVTSLQQYLRPTSSQQLVLSASAGHEDSDWGRQGKPSPTP